MPKRPDVDIFDANASERSTKKRILLLKSQKYKTNDKELETEEDQEFREIIPPNTDTFPVIVFLKSLLDQRLPPLVFQHQIYALLKNRTHVDCEIETLTQQKHIIQFKLEHCINSVGLMLFKDYEQLLLLAMAKQQQQANSVLSKFLHHLRSHDLTVALDGHFVISEMNVTDRDMTVLVNYGFLTIRDAKSFWLGVPNVGNLLSQLMKGRKEIRRCLKRKPFQEMLEQDILKRTFKHILLNIRYILLDMEGTGCIESSSVTSGTIYRLKKMT
jgi:serine/threonine-protein kinase 19